MSAQKDTKHGLGRRKRAVARVRLIPGKGRLVVNGKADKEFESSEFHRTYMKAALVAGLPEGQADNFDVIAITNGGGVSGQRDAIRLGIARAVLSLNQLARPLLKPLGLLKRDDRRKERKKFGLHKARKGTQFSKR